MPKKVKPAVALPEGCPGCGDIANNRIIAAYTLHLNGKPHPRRKHKGKCLGPFPSHNQLVGNHAGKSGWLYRRFRDWCIDEFTRGTWSHSEWAPDYTSLHCSWSVGGLPKQQDYFRRIFVTRNIGKGKRAFDEHNSYGGLKGLIDGLVETGVLHDDTPKYCKIFVKQVKCLLKCECADILIQDVQYAERAR